MEIEQNEVEKHSNGSEISEWDDMSINEKDGCTIRLVPPIEITSTSPVPSMVELNGHTQENGDMSDVTDNGVNSALPPLTATSTPTESISGLPAKRPTSLRTMSERRPARTLRRHGTEPNFRKGRPGLNPVRSDILNHYYLRVPAGSGRTSPSVISMQSDPESCLDGYPNDEDTDDMMVVNEDAC